MSSFVYDAENRLVGASGAKTASLTYDPLGRLWQVAGTGATTRFLYDGDELIAEYDTSGTLLRRYVHSDAADDPLVWYEGSGTASPRYIHTNHQGSVVAVADTSGNLLAINSYDEYGIPGATNVGRFQYTGQSWLPELGMYYYKARIYSPTLGRFMQTDPIGYKDQQNLYAYVANDPVNRNDPTGLQRAEEITHSQFEKYRALGMSDEEATQKVASDAWTATKVSSLFVAPEAFLIARLGVTAGRLMRSAEFFKPVVGGFAAASQRFSAVVSNLKGLAAGEFRVFAWGSRQAGSKELFRGTEAAAKKYGGQAADYTKVSASRVTAYQFMQFVMR